MTNKEYGLFDGRRSADEYVKGYLKGIAVISGIGLAIFVGFSGWIALTVNEHSERLSVIESSVFTHKDAAPIFSEIHKEIKAMRNDISKLPTESPPKWLLEMVHQNSTEIRELQRK